MSISRPNRRDLLSASALIGAAPLAAAAEQLTRTGVVWAPNTGAWPAATDLRARYIFFSGPEADFIEAACARLIPADAVGPSALEAGVPLFLDRQLAGEYGTGARLYMQGPFAKGSPTQGYQSRHPPAGLHRAAIQAIDGWCDGPTYS